ncbi:MAG TPA: HYExAFE family protein [Sedimentisphaerales bacterium]|nr:HYExAFE family protein [Sedimentisphaerales bacterium]
MRDFSPNEYERAFENWLVDNHVQYVSGEENKKAVFKSLRLKSFDFLLYPANQQKIIAEVKGRSFKGTTLAKLAGLECWVTAEDVDGLASWEEVFGAGHTAAFVFAYRIENVDVDFDGRDCYEFGGGRYIFFAVKLDDYRRFMKRRSPKWKTVTLPADKFRRCAVQMQKLLS